MLVVHVIPELKVLTVNEQNNLHYIYIYVFIFPEKPMLNDLNG